MNLPYPHTPIQCSLLLCSAFSCALCDITFPTPWVGQASSTLIHPIRVRARALSLKTPDIFLNYFPHTAAWLGASPLGVCGILCCPSLSHCDLAL